MSESVKILIEAENRASAVIDTTAKDIDNKVKAIKASGEQAKKSTEFFGTIANALGGSEIGAFASQLGQVTEKTSQFAEVQKLGGAGALAFKGGLVAAVGVIAFQFGQAIGNAIFQTERWKKALADATKEAERLEAKLIAVKAQRFDENKSDIELIRDPEAKKQAYAELFKSTNKEIEGVERRVKEARKAVEDYDASWTPAWIQGSNEEAEKRLKTDREALDVLVKQREETKSEFLERQAANKEIEKQNSLKDKSDDFLKGLREELELLKASKEEQAAILAARNTVGVEAQEEAKSLLLAKQKIAADEEASKLREQANEKALQEQEALVKSSSDYVKSLQQQLALLKAPESEKPEIQAEQKTIGADTSTAAKLLKEIESIKAVAEFSKMMDGELAKIQSEKEASAKRIIDLKQGELDKLEEERILLNKGAEAAAAFRLMKQGLAEDDAKEIARQQSELAKLKEDKKPGKVAKDGAPQLQANESRLLTRGEGDDPTKQVAVNTANAFRELQLLNKRLTEAGKNNLTLKVIGAGM